MNRRLRSGGRWDFPAVALAAAVLWLITPGGATPARAEPAFAVTTGYSCGQCHVNRSGGGMRTAFGSLYTQTILPVRLLTWRDRGYLLPADPDARFGFGGDFRFGSYNINSDDYDDVSTFEVPAANLYAQVRLVPQRLSLYIDQDVGSGSSSSRELFALLSSRKGTGYVKLGKFVPPYGWALPDDDAFIREPLGFAFSGSDLGIEAGFEPGNWSLQASVINGSAGSRDIDRTKKFTLLTARRFKRGKIGVSGANDITGGTTTTWAGLLGGLNVGRLSLLAEGDWRSASPDDASTTKLLAAYVEANLLIRRGLNLKYAHDWIDPDRDVRTDQRNRDSLGIEYIPYPFVQLRATVRHKDGPPQVPGSRDTQVDLEAHLFF